VHRATSQLLHKYNSVIVFFVNQLSSPVTTD